MGRLLSRLEDPKTLPPPPPHGRPIRALLVIMGSYMPESYWVDLFRIYRSSFYMAPEVAGDPWAKLGDLLTKYFSEEYGIGGDSTLDEFPEPVETMAGLMTDRIDYSKYLAPNLRWPTRLTQESFSGVIAVNREWLTGK